MVRLLVSYSCPHRSLVVTKEGRGPTISAAIADADEQLRPGFWRRLVVSNPDPIQSSLAGPPARRHPAAFRSAEGAAVIVRPPRVLPR